MDTVVALRLILNRIPEIIIENKFDRALLYQRRFYFLNVMNLGLELDFKICPAGVVCHTLVTTVLAALKLKDKKLIGNSLSKKQENTLKKYMEFENDVKGPHIVHSLTLASTIHYYYHRVRIPGKMSKETLFDYLDKTSDMHAKFGMDKEEFNRTWDVLKQHDLM